MQNFQLLLLILAAAAALQVPARRFGVPHPVLLVLGGAVLAFVPGLPQVAIDPEVAFVIFVPPLLYATAISSSFMEFRNEKWPIARLGVLLVLATIGAVALTAHALTPEFTWPAAFVLAAIVAPPDPVAATAVLRTLDAPSELVSILEGEGLVNDATALVAYRVAVAAVVTGTFSASRASAGLLLTSAGGVIVGVLTGYGIGWLRQHIRGLPVVENTVSLLTPFAAYLAADKVGASGVLSVVAVGLYLGRIGPHVVRAATRVQAEAMWSMLTTWLEGLTFMLIGLELPVAYHALRAHSLAALLGYAAAVSGVVMGLRLIWVWPSAYLPRLFTRRHSSDGDDAHPLPPWRWVLTVGWAGMRGADSVVIALALPLTTIAGSAFPARDLIVFVTFAVIFATLVLQGMTLRPLLRLLGVREGNRAEVEEHRALRAMEAASDRVLDGIGNRDGVADDVVDLLRGARRQEEPPPVRALRRKVLDAERAALLDLRDRGTVGEDVMQRLQRDLDLETMLLDAAEDDAPESPYEGNQPA